MESLKFKNKRLIEFPTYFYENGKPIRILNGNYPIWDNYEENGVEWAYPQKFRNSKIRHCSDNPEKVANFIIEEVEKNKEAIEKYIKRLQNQIDRMEKMIQIEIEPFLNKRGYVAPTAKYDERKMAMPYSKIFIGGTPVFEDGGIVCLEYIDFNGKLKKNRMNFPKRDCKIMDFYDAIEYRKSFIKEEKKKAQKILRELEESYDILSNYDFDILIEYTF